MWSIFWYDQEFSPKLPKPYTKLQKTDPTYKIDHSNLFGEKHFEWPPSKDELVRSIGEHVMNRFTSNRKLEVIYFCNKAWPMPKDEAIEYQFFDVHPSLGRLTGDGARSPWHNNILATIVTTSEMVMRYRGPDGKSAIRVLTGRELFQFAGRDSRFFRQKPMQDSELGAMAGNCFNGFAVAALYASLFAAMGHTYECEEEAKEDDVISCDDGQSSDCSDYS